MTETGTSIRTRISLLRGQSYFAQLRRGSVISVAEGSLVVISRLPLEHSVLMVQTPVQRGGVYCVPLSGQFEITAQSDAALCLVSPEYLFSMASLWSGFFRLPTRKPRLQTL